MKTAFFLSSGPPFPEVGARRIRDQQILNLLAKRFNRVEAVCLGDPRDLARYREETLRAFGPRVTLHLYSAKEQGLTSRGMDLIRPHFAQGHHSSIAAFLSATAKPGDVFWLSRLRMAKYIDLANELGCAAILDEHQVESDLLFDNAFSSLRYWYQGVEAIRCALYERKIVEDASLVVAGADIDLPRMRKLNARAQVKVVPYSVDPKHYVLPQLPESDPPMVLFFGDLDYVPAVHAIDWLAKEIFPRLKAALGPRFPRFVVGTSYIPPGIEKRYPEVEFQRTLSHQDVLDQLARSKLVVFPLRYGRGNRINLLEAMAAGVPIVSTGRGADGVPVVPTRDFLVAEGADDFTSSILRLLNNPADRDSLGSRARQTAQAIFTAQHGPEKFDALLAELAKSHPANT